MTLELTIERAVAGGRMLARHEGRVVLVSGAIPGERVVARIDHASRKVAFASTIDVIEPSPHRRVPICDAACGGSAYTHITIEHQRQLKADVIVDAFRRLGRLTLDAPVSVAPSPEEGYRLRGRLHVRHGRVGFFLERSHRLCDAASTKQFREDTLPVVARVVEMAGPSAEDCEAVLVAENVDASQRVCHLEPKDGRRMDRANVTWALFDGVTGITTRVGDRLMILAGDGRVADTAQQLCGSTSIVPERVTWARTAASFFQGNRFLTGALLHRVLELGGHGRVLDLYAGVGLFSVGFAARGSDVTAVEGDGTSVGDLEINTECCAGRVTTWQASVESAVATCAPGAFDLVVIDPPRTGASPDAIGGLLSLAAPRVIYVSCDPATLARDAALLTKQSYRLTSVEAFDLFPNTPHVETLAVFDRVLP